MSESDVGWTATTEGGRMDEAGGPPPEARVAAQHGRRTGRRLPRSVRALRDGTLAALRAPSPHQNRPLNQNVQLSLCPGFRRRFAGTSSAFGFMLFYNLDNPHWRLVRAGRHASEHLSYALVRPGPRRLVQRLNGPDLCLESVLSHSRREICAADLCNEALPRRL